MKDVEWECWMNNTHNLHNTARRQSQVMKEPTRNSLSLSPLCIKYQACIISQATLSYTHVRWEIIEVKWGSVREEIENYRMMRRRWFVSNLTTMNVKMLTNPPLPISLPTCELSLKLVSRLNCSRNVYFENNFMTIFIGHMRWWYWLWRYASMQFN